MEVKHRVLAIQMLHKQIEKLNIEIRLSEAKIDEIYAIYGMIYVMSNQVYYSRDEAGQFVKKSFGYNEKDDLDTILAELQSKTSLCRRAITKLNSILKQI